MKARTGAVVSGDENRRGGGRDAVVSVYFFPYVAFAARKGAKSGSAFCQAAKKSSCFLTLRRLTVERSGARLSQICQRVKSGERRLSTVSENLLKFREGLRAAPELQIGLTAQVLRPEFGGGFVARDAPRPFRRAQAVRAAGKR